MVLLIFYQTYMVMYEYKKSNNNSNLNSKEHFGTNKYILKNQIV